MNNSIWNRFRQVVHNQFRNNEIKLHELNYLFWECTHKCNLKCLHCGSDCSLDTGTPDMPFEDFLKSIQPLKEKFRKDTITVVFTGGEPLLRKDLADCGRILREHGFRWGIVTNGFSYNQEIHGRLLGAGMGAITLSLDGMADNHNWLRNHPNSFEHAVSAMDLIVSSQRLNYDVVTCVHPGNISELPVLMEFLIEKHVKSWRLFTIAPIGRAIDNQGLQLNRDQLVFLMEFISKARKEKRIDTKFSCEAYVGNYELKVRDSFFFCRAGINIASVLVDGSISACPNVDKHFIQGNIYSDDFHHIWENEFRMMRDRSWTKVGVCFECSDYQNCMGGAMHLWTEKKECTQFCINNHLKLDRKKHFKFT